MTALLQNMFTAAKQAALGFGCMRLPTLNNKTTPFTHSEPSTESPEDDIIDLEQLCDMVDVFLGAGFTYFDTARSYHQGGAEGAIKRALVDRYPRESFQLATKLPAYLATSAAAAQHLFFISLDDTRSTYFDSYLLHNLGGPRTAYFDTYGIWDFVREQQAAGLIDKIGFSFHGTPEELDLLLKMHSYIDFVQLQINYLDWDDALIQARRCYELARSYECEIVVMEPLKGGLLARLPPTILQLLDEQPADLTAITLALRFAASLEGVATVLSGMSTLEQMQQNCMIMQDTSSLSSRDRAQIAHIMHAMGQLNTVACTNCGYCRDVCTRGVCIPQVIQALNMLEVFNDETRVRESYLWAGAGKASLCTRCQACEEVCPQRLPLIKILQHAVIMLEGDVFDDHG